MFENMGIFKCAENLEEKERERERERVIQGRVFEKD